jgi:hypothetical protein
MEVPVASKISVSGQVSPAGVLESPVRVSVETVAVPWWESLLGAGFVTLAALLLLEAVRG